MVFALSAEPKSTGLTDGDVKNWAKNLSAIQNELDDLGLDVDDLTSVSKKDYAKAEAVLQKYGIKAPKSVEKYAMINQCATVLMAESQMDAVDAQSMAMRKAMGIDPLAQLKESVNSKDYKLVEANSKAVIKAMNGYSDSIPGSQSGPYDANEANEEYLAIVRGKLQPEVDSINKSAESIKKIYEYLSSGKKAGAGKTLYTTLDKENASKYKKQKVAANQLPIVISCNSSGEEGVNDGLTAVVDFKNKKVSFEFTWVEAELEESTEFNLTSVHGIKKNEVTKTISTKIKSSEFYLLEKGEYDGTAREFTIVTKEGAVIHLWNSTSFDGNEYNVKVQFGDIEASDIGSSWYEE